MEQTSTPASASLGQPLHSWSAPSSAHHVRSERWYVVGGILVLLGAAYGIVTGAWTVTVVVVLCGAMYVLLRNHIPPSRTIAIQEQGVLFDNNFTRWEDIGGFWFIHARDFTELHFSRKTKGPDIVIHTTGNEEKDLQTLIGRFVPQLTDRKERLIDIIIRICKL